MSKKRSVTLIVGNGTPLVAKRDNPGRNSPCKCGPGKKAKNCCGTEAKFFHSDYLKKQKNVTEQGPDKKD